MSKKRKGITTKTRFEVFKRDGFVCQYCGAHPPAAILHVDHIIAVAAGGADDMDNYITSCDRCNLGKGARDLAVAPMSLPEKAALVAEREAQLKGYCDIMAAARQRLDDDVWGVVSIFEDGRETFPRDWLASIRRFVERLGYPDVSCAMMDAAARIPHPENARFKYFCGICWNKIREQGQI